MYTIFGPKVTQKTLSNLSTLIDEKNAQQLTKVIGRLIRDFLSFVNDPESGGIFAEVDNNRKTLQNIEPAIKELAGLFRDQPGLFEDEQLVGYGENYARAMAHPVRIEVRRVPEVNGVAQIAARGIYGPFRTVVIEYLKAHARVSAEKYYVRLSGNASFEINIQGVNKALPLYYLSVKWEDVMRECGYHAGVFIDAAKTRTLIAADGDGTTWESPQNGRAPTLHESPVHAPLLTYLRHGGIYLVISGNHLDRTINRVRDHIPVEIRPQVLIAANGGANLVRFTSTGDAREVGGYHTAALEVIRPTVPEIQLDAIYLGDDGRQSGNDREAFEAVGAERSILVANQLPADIIPFLADKKIGGLVHGTRRALEFVNRQVQDHPHNKIFTRANIQDLVRAATQA